MAVLQEIVVNQVQPKRNNYVYDQPPDTSDFYLSLVISQYAIRQKFMSYCKSMLDKLCPINDCLNEFDKRFNLNTAVGDQLDKLGQLVDITRELPEGNPDIPSVLPDDLFRLVIRNRIYTNFWDGTREQLEFIINDLLPEISYEMVDGQDMTIQYIIIYPNATPALLALLLGGYVLPKPSGVSVSYTIQESALFGWDTDTAFIKGWDQGTWASA